MENPFGSPACIYTLYLAHVKLDKQIHLTNGDAKRILRKTLAELDKKLEAILLNAEKDPEHCHGTGNERCKECPAYENVHKSLKPK